MKRNIFLNLWVLIFPMTLCGNDIKVETIDGFSFPKASKSVQNSLEPEGYRVLRDNGDVLCEIWLRDSIPTQTETGELGAVYPQLSKSILVGVLSFPNGGGDCQGQSIKQGTYTLRYELLPNDGNHMGAAPTRDFLLLSPVTIDSIVESHYTFDELTTMSKEASGTTHPASFNMIYPESEEDLPMVIKTFEGYIVFIAPLKTQAGDRLIIALIVEGETE